MKDPISFQRFGIYGVGLLGGSLGLALKRLYPDMEIVGVGRSAERLRTACKIGAIDSYTCDPSSIDPVLDALVLCTPVRLVPQILRSMLGAIKKEAVVTDVGSTKQTLVQECEEAAQGYCYFVGSHPMAGSHKTGVEAARSDLFRHKICIVTETSQTHQPAVETVVSLWNAIGMRVVRMSPEKHDQLTAYSSHLPHLTAALLCQAVKSQGEQINPVLGNGFRDTTRIAQGDPSMWVDICLENRRAILDSLSSFRHVLSELYECIESSDEDGIRDILTQAQVWMRSRRSS
ncbi:MAG: prephenate dehydrogenase/arogenate dehydrogenase family protein [Candidatus Omnitrophica bacterium]|nr:prephenate dehydrogenase/arogenate dehydrogenase family protein [Candidatus Omnitrophota bacterium]